MKDFKKALRPLKTKIHINNTIYCLTIGLLVACSVSFALSLASLFVPVPFLSETVIKAFAAIMIISIVVSAFLSPGNNKVINTADSLGLKERIVTAFQLKDDNSKLSQVQRTDALNKLKTTQLDKLYVIRVEKRGLTASLVMIILTISFFFIPSSTRDEALKMENVVKEIEKQADNIEAEKSKLLEENDDDMKIKEIEKELDKLLEKLKKTKNEEEALKELSKALHDLEKLKTDEKDKLLSRLEKGMESNTPGQMAKAIEDNDTKEIADKMEQLKNELEKMNDGQREEMIEQLKQAANEVEDEDLDLSDDIKKAADNIDKGNMQEAAEKLAEALQNMQKSTGNNLSAAGGNGAEGLESAINAARRSIASASGNNVMLSRYGSPEGQSKSGSAGNARGQSGQGGQGGDGQSGQNGQGDTPMPGRGGSGAGDGASDKDTGYFEESGGGSRQAGEGEFAEYEEIYTPKRLGDGGEITNITGTAGEAGSSMWHDGANTPVESGSIVPYNQVLTQYKQEAFTSIERADIPPGMKEIVRDYFTGLE